MQKSTLDLSFKNIPPLFYAMQGDTDRQVQVALFDNGVLYDASSDAVSVWYSGPGGDGNFSEGISIEKNVLTITLSGNVTAVPGNYALAVMLSRSNGKVSTWNMILKVGVVPGYGSPAAQDYFEAFQAGELAQRIESVNARITSEVATLNGSIANESASLANRIDAVDSRISGIVADGQQTEGNTELIDIRTGWDGTKYSTAGDAVRGQVSSLYKQNLSLRDDLNDVVTFPKIVNPFTEENFNYLGQNNISPVFEDDGFYFETSGINDSSIWFDVNGLILGHNYELSFDVLKDEIYKISIGDYIINNASGKQSYKFIAESSTISINMTIWYTESNFKISTSELIDLDEKTILLEESRAKQAEKELQNQIERRISKEELKDVISFSGQSTNPLVEDNYKYLGSNNISLSFSENGFTISNPDGVNDVDMWFDISNLIIGHKYSISFNVAVGELYLVRTSDFSKNNVSGVFDCQFTSENGSQSINLGIWYTNQTVTVEDVKLIDLAEKTHLIDDHWYKNKKGVRFGDSITAQADFWEEGDLEGSGWSILVKEYFGCADIVNCGIGGSTISGDSVTNAMWTDERINALPEDSDFILFMGGTNDWGQNKELGEPDSVDTNTFNGALNVIAQKLIERFPDKLILWMCNVYGKKINDGEKNSLGLTLYDYSRAFIENANRNGLFAIDMYKSWTKYNYAEYLNSEAEGTTFIHPNKKGGVKMANIIIHGMLKIEPLIQ